MNKGDAGPCAMNDGKNTSGVIRDVMGATDSGWGSK